MEYIYNGIDKNAVRQEGKIEANTERDVVEFLRESNITPITIKRIQKQEFFIISYLNRITTGDIVIFTRQLSSMITTGLTLMEALTILKQQNNKSKMQEIINNLISQISEGSSFSQALEQHKTVFSEVYIALVKAAETGGMLDKILQRLADNLERAQDLKKKVKSAMFYPGIVVTGVVIVIAIMNIFVIPQLGKMYENMNLKLPLMTQIVLGMSKFFTNFYPVIILAGIGGTVLYNRLRKSEKGLLVIDELKLKIPVLGDIIKLTLLDEVTRTLSLLVGSGASIIESLNITANVAGNIHYKRAVKSTSTLVETGVPLSGAMEHQNIFPPVLIQMVKVGESTGRIDDSLMKMADYFERDLEIKVRTLTTSIEPILIIFLGGAVGFLILSVITPIYSLISQIQ